MRIVHGKTKAASFKLHELCEGGFGVSDEKFDQPGGGTPEGSFLNGAPERDTLVDQPTFTEETAPEEPEPMPANVAELCAACVRFIAAKYGVALDFSPHTLSLLDQYVRDARAEVQVKPDSLPLLQTTLGAYLGEVIRRAHHGIWDAEGDHDGWRVLMTRVYLTFNPIGMLREALLLEQAPGWNAHLEADVEERETLDQRLANLPQVDEDEYYAPTTRFDVVEIAVDAIAAHMRQSGLGDVRFSREDYK
jgi:hypothetical protein